LLTDGWYTRAVCKVRGLTFLLRAGTSWRCGDGPFFEVPPLAKRFTSYNAPPTFRKRAVDRWLLRNFLPRSSFTWLEKPRNRMWRGLDCMADVLMGFHRSTFSKPKTEFNSDLTPCDFWAFSTMKRELRCKKFRSDQRSVARFSRSGCSVARSALLAKRGTSKKRPLPHLHEVPTRSNKVSPRTLQTVLLFTQNRRRSEQRIEYQVKL
jgi:hypothetical protein